MQQVPLQSVPNQQLQTVLGGQNCQIAVYQKTQGLFVDLNVNSVDVSTGILALNAIPVCPFNYAPFSGYLMFLDMQGSDDPTYTGLGSRFLLIYLTEADVANLL